MQHGGRSIQAIKFVKTKVHCQDVRGGSHGGRGWGRVASLSLGIYLLWAVINQGAEQSLLGGGKQFGVFFLPNLVRFPVMASAILRLSGGIWFLLGCCRHRPLTFSIAGQDFLIAGLHITCQNLTHGQLCVQNSCTVFSPYPPNHPSQHHFY